MAGLGIGQHAATAVEADESHVDPFSASAWDSHRATITDLYQTKNLPLKQVMEYMRSRHGFKATMKMYKYRINRWNLRKYLRHRDVEEFVRSNETPKIRGANVSRQRIDKYLQRRWRERTAKKYDEALLHVNTLYDDQKTDGSSSTALSIVANKVQVPQPSLFSLHSPDDLRLLEGSIHAMRSYPSGKFDAKIWVLDTQGSLNVHDRALEWHGTWYTVRHLMEAGRAKQAFRIVQKCNQVFEEILVGDSPRFFSSALLVFLDLSANWPDLATSIIRYMYSLSRIMFGDSNHPMVKFLSNICKLGTEELRQYGHTLANASVTILQNFFPLHSRAHSETGVNMARDLFHLNIINGDSAVSQILTIIRQLETSDEVDPQIILSAKRELTYVYLWMKDYTKALQLVSEILLPTNRGLIERTYTEAVSYRLLFQIHSALGNQREAISACQKVVKLCTELYGLADDFTVNNLAAYESYLRECGNYDEADQVKDTLKGAMDGLCNGLEELGLV